MDWPAVVSQLESSPVAGDEYMRAGGHKAARLTARHATNRNGRCRGYSMSDQSIAPSLLVESFGRQAWADWAGMLASVGCAIHCASLPLLIGYLPGHRMVGRRGLPPVDGGDLRHSGDGCVHTRLAKASEFYPCGVWGKRSLAVDDLRIWHGKRLLPHLLR